MANEIITPRSDEAYSAWASKMGVGQSRAAPNSTNKRVRGGRSYLLVDDTASGGPKVELNTTTCAHCGEVKFLRDATAKKVLNVPMRVRPRQYCSKCNAYICDKKGCNDECIPQLKALELALKYTDQYIPLDRGKNGELLFDHKLVEIGKLF